MPECQFVRTAGSWTCSVCRFVFEGASDVPPISVCGRQQIPRIPGISGPGDYLHDAILSWVGEGPTRECGCTDRINQMNAWGPAGCREHLDEIVGWLVEQAKTHKWVETTTDSEGNEIVSEVSPSLTAQFGRWMARGKQRKILLCVVVRWMVLGEIKKAEATAVQSGGL